MRGDVELAKKMFAQVPPDWGKIDALLSETRFSDEELAAIAIDLTDDCFCEYRDAMNEDLPDITPETMHSNYLMQSLRTLLAHGLNPNTIYNDENVLWNIQYVDAPGVAGSAMRLLLENGGNPNLYFPADGETLYNYISGKISFDEIDDEYFNIFQCWIVLLAYGGGQSGENVPLTMLNGHGIDMLRDFEHYDFTVEPLSQDAGYQGRCRMHIYNKNTGEDVALYG